MKARNEEENGGKYQRHRKQAENSVKGTTDEISVLSVSVLLHSAPRQWPCPDRWWPCPDRQWPCPDRWCQPSPDRSEAGISPTEAGR